VLHDFGLSALVDDNRDAPGGIASAVEMPKCSASSGRLSVASSNPVACQKIFARSNSSRTRWSA
jgi:hypothetical protein